MKWITVIIFFSFTIAFASIDKDSINFINDAAYQQLAIDLEKTDSLLTISMSLHDSIDYPLGKINTFTIYGIMYKNKGFYETATKNYLKALEIANQIKDTARISAIKNNLGIIYLNQKNYEKAIKQWEESLEIENQLNNEIQKSIRLYNLGDAYLNLGKAELAQTYFLSSLLLEQKNSNNEGEAYAKLGLLKAQLMQDIQIKEQEIQTLKDKIKDLNTPSLNIDFYHFIGDYFIKSNKFDSSLAYYNKSIQLANHKDFQHQKLTSLEKIHAAYSKNGDYEKAYQILLQYNTLNEILNSALKSSRIEELQHIYTLEKKQDEIQLLEQEKNIVALELEKKNSIRNYLFITLILIALFYITNISKLIKR